jgi:DnaJ-class molecular chaperone
MTGCTITVEGIDNKILETTIPSGVQNETILGISGHGMPNFNNPSQRGRLLVKVKITIPKLTEGQKNLLKTMNIN